MKIPAKSTIYEETIKKSRFVVKVFPLDSFNDFDALLETHSDVSANHNCWAWKVDNQYRFSDDGEPSGTAGKPIFQSIDMKGWIKTAVIITRYFGGIKLGAGGLIRAYGGTASRALDNTPFKESVSYKSVTIKASHDLTGLVYTLLNKYNVTAETVDYIESTVVFSFNLAEKRVNDFSAECRDESSGKISLKIE